jgi:2-polyprenyl-3-methyl-5-hydroxy-6-metoxy-1,4-benzoquinol methylase
MNKKIYSTNIDSYESKFINGYGISTPESHIVRFNHAVLRYQLNLTGGNLLDFGCGNGIHAKWFSEIGEWTPFGCDTSKTAIKIARSNNQKFTDNFYVCSPYESLPEKYHNFFDLIICNQVLYYFDEIGLERIIDELFICLKPGGVIFASMMPKENYLYKKSHPIVDSKMRKVIVKGRVQDVTLINFKTKSEMLHDFKKFEKLHIGYYDSVIREDDGSIMHLTFSGIRPK